jgi:protein SCO1/2|tara:strand:+ start:11479 stop:12186 length:708 start_codon:yes stop_codon:yes gene_type:complete
MKFNIKSFSTIIVLILLLVVPPIIYSYVTKGFNNFIKLDIVGERDLDTGEYHTISEFSFINQLGEQVNNDSMKGNIYIADFFFTNCPSICPVMTKNMAYVQNKLKVYPNIKFLSHTVDPANDSPLRFKEYINEMRLKNINIDESNWDFVTGKKEEIYDVAKSYFVNVSADSLAPGGFLHSEYFVLVDKEGRIRSGIDKNGNVVGVYDGTNEAQLRDLINDVKVLMAEYKRPKKNK